jgi:hypothetical protein
MSTRPTLHDFIDEELLRAPICFDGVIDAVQDSWRLRMPPQGRHGGDPLRVLQQHRDDVMSTALAHLRSSLQADLHKAAAAPGSAPGGSAAARQMPLSLIDEDDINVDIEIARCTETIKLKAELELRALQTYTSALVNDLNVSRDTNPLRPERFVRALWAGVQVLPFSRPLMTALMHDAAQPLAEALQRSYDAAWHRLDEQGVVPATHRTIVVGGAGVMGGGNWGGDTGRYQPPLDLKQLRDSMPAPLDRPDSAATTRQATPPSRPSPPAASGNAFQARPGAGQSLAPSGASGPDPQLIALLARLFEAIQSEFGLAPDAVSLMQRLQPTALRVALRDPSLLDSYDHPLWRFMDRLTHDILLSAPAQRLRLLGLGRNLIDHLAATDLAGEQGFDWALARLQAAQHHALAQALMAAAPEVDRLQRLAGEQVASTTRPLPLDISTLDTVPAALMTEPAAAQPAAAALSAEGLAPGSALRAYLQGDWRTLVALWQDDGHELLLLREPASERLWALRQRALARLMSEGLAQPLRVRSLARRAADRVLRTL